MTPRFFRGFQMLGSVRARLMALLTMAAIPLVGLAALVVWQNYAITLAQAAQQAMLARESGGGAP